MEEKMTPPLQNYDHEGSETFNLRSHARYVGRMDWSDPSGPVLSWAGSSIAARFQGASISLNMAITERNETWIDIVLDGVPLPKLHIDGTGSFVLADGLDNRIHTLEIYKRTEAMFGTIQFLGFKLPEGGQFLSPPKHLQRRMEIIGDSISCGSGNEGKNGDPNIAEHENNSLAYGTLAARALNAELYTIAISGIGLVVNYGDERTHTMPNQYERVNPLDPDNKWDFTAWVPDVVVINLGTNDSNYSVDEREFVEAYRSFVGRIRSRYNDTEIIMSLGPFQQSPMKDYIAKAVEIIRATGDQKVHYHLFDRVDIERDGLGETGHPNLITHAKMAEQLTCEIKRIVGW